MTRGLLASCSSNLSAETPGNQEQAEWRNGEGAAPEADGASFFLPSMPPTVTSVDLEG